METPFTPEAFAILLQRYIENRYSAADVELLVQLIDEPEYQLLAIEMIEGTMEKMRERQTTQDPALLTRLDGRLAPIIEEEKFVAPVHRVHFLKRFRWAAAALFFVIAGATLFFLLQPAPKQVTQPIVYKNNVMPGRPGAKLKLSDGREIVIDSLKDGLIAMEGSLRILKQAGRIVYEGKAEEALYNEVIADRGRETSAELPDGSVVYLNAGSRLRYPLKFAGNERLVEMSGEAYFEVVHNANQPFKVKAGNTTIEDIGTVFNVNAYNNEPATVTTLVEGSISIEGKTLQPGQQFKEGLVSKANITNAIAWHKGLFSFEHASLEAVMRQLERWYDVEVKYEGSIPKETFTGEMKRNLTLAEVLDFMQSMHVKFRIEEDKRIVIQP